jgi:hypothetical protein
MLETIEGVRMLTVMEIVGPALLGVALIYAAVRWSSRWRGRMDAMRKAATHKLYRRAREERLEHDLVPAGVAPQGQMADPCARLPNPKILGKLRSGREDNRPSEDDLVRQHMGPRGLPGEPARPNALRESETQIPKPLDPGHTA